MFSCDEWGTRAFLFVFPGVMANAGFTHVPVLAFCCNNSFLCTGRRRLFFLCDGAARGVRWSEEGAFVVHFSGVMASAASARLLLA